MEIRKQSRVDAYRAPWREDLTILYAYTKDRLREMDSLIKFDVLEDALSFHLYMDIRAKLIQVLVYNYKGGEDKSIPAMKKLIDVMIYKKLQYRYIFVEDVFIPEGVNPPLKGLKKMTREQQEEIAELAKQYPEDKDTRELFDLISRYTNAICEFYNYKIMTPEFIDMIIRYARRFVLSVMHYGIDTHVSDMYVKEYIRKRIGSKVKLDLLHRAQRVGL